MEEKKTEDKEKEENKKRGFFLGDPYAEVDF